MERTLLLISCDGFLRYQVYQLGWYSTFNGFVLANLVACRRCLGLKLDNLPSEWIRNYDPLWFTFRRHCCLWVRTREHVLPNRGTEPNGIRYHIFCLLHSEMTEPHTGSSVAFGPACGICFNLTLLNTFLSDPPFYPNVTKSVVIKVTDLCPLSKNGWCSGTKNKPNS